MSSVLKKADKLNLSLSLSLFGLTCLTLDKMAAISQTIFSWMKSFVCWFKFHWSDQGQIDSKSALV